MKIQDMRAGILHLSKRVEIERRDILELLPPPAEMFAAPQPEPKPAQTAPEPESQPATSITCDLDEPCWSVVSFGQTEAGGLTYRQAAALLNVLEGNNVPGLCIITDEAAKRTAA